MSKKRPKMNLQTVIERLNASANPDKVAFKMAKFGIAAENALGVYQADLKVIASEIGLNSALGLALFDSGVYEARLLCSKVFDPADLSSAQMQAWAQTFENWEICDSFCMGLFARSPLALDKIRHWTTQEAEFVKRAGFATMAAYGFANKKVANDVFEGFLPIIERESGDDRLYVKKAVNWALRSIGKRNVDLHSLACASARRLLRAPPACARWIAKDALKELEQPGVKMLDYPRAIYRHEYRAKA